jgi:hypothetical protein
MNRSARKRVEQIAVSLNPEQAFLLWLEEAQQFDSLGEMAHWMKDQPESAYPLVKLTHQVEQAVEQAMKGQDRERIHPAVRAAVKEVGFLYFLHGQLTQRLLEEKKALWLHLALTASGLKSAFLHDDPMDLSEWVDHAVQCIGDYCTWQSTVEQLAQRYYRGQWPLFPDARRLLLLYRDSVEQVITLFNDHRDFLHEVWPAKLRKQLPAPLDLAQLAQQAEPYATAQAELLVDLARFKACDLLGEREQGYRYLDRHV